MNTTLTREEKRRLLALLDPPDKAETQRRKDTMRLLKERSELSFALAGIPFQDILREDSDAYKKFIDIRERMIQIQDELESIHPRTKEQRRRHASFGL